MIWEGYELLPVVEEGRLIGVVSRKDVIKAIQYMRSQPQMGETLEDVILSNFGSKRIENRVRFTGKVTPVLASQMGAVSWSALAMLMSTAAIVSLKTSASRILLLIPLQFSLFSLYNWRICWKLKCSRWRKAEFTIR